MFNRNKITFYSIASPFLAAAFLFIMSPQAHAKINVMGEREFVDGVNECLNTYRNDPGIVGDVIKELEKSDYEHRIINSPDWTNTVNNADNAFNGKGCGTVTKVDKTELEKYKKAFPELANKDYCTAILHELWHAVDSDRGEWSTDRENGVKKNEIEATIFQNFVHAIRGVDPRTSYAGVDIAVIKKGEETDRTAPEKPAEPEKIKINVIDYKGAYIPIDLLKVYTKEACGCCDSDHYHAPGGSVKSIDGKTVTDPYNNCGLGKTSAATTIEKPIK